jgi:hypothetical protein
LRPKPVRLPDPVDTTTCRIQSQDCQVLGGIWSCPSDPKLERRLQDITSSLSIGTEIPDRDREIAQQCIDILGGDILSPPREMQPFGNDAIY